MAFRNFCKREQGKYADTSFANQRDLLAQDWLALTQEQQDDYLAQDDGAQEDGAEPASAPKKFLAEWALQSKLITPTENALTPLLRAGWDNLELIKSEFDLNIDIPEHYPKRFRARLIAAVTKLQGQQEQPREKQPQQIQIVHIYQHHQHVQVYQDQGISYDPYDNIKSNFLKNYIRW